MNKKNTILQLQLVTTLLFVLCCSFIFFRKMPSSGGVPGLSGLEAVVFVFPYMFSLFINAINIILVFFKKRGFPIFLVIATTLFLIVFCWLTNDWNYDIDESISMYLLGPFMLKIVSILVLIIRNKIKKNSTISKENTSKLS